MMGHQEIIDHQILERYVRGQLAEAQVARFEEHYLTCEECVRDLELAERFRHGLAGIATEETLRTGILAALARAASQRWLPLLALLLVAILPVAQWLHYGAEKQRHAALAPEVVLPLAVERSSTTSAGPRLTLLPDMQWIALTVDPGLEGTLSEASSSREIPYRVEGPSGDSLLQGTSRGTAGSKTLLLVLEAGRLEDGEHTLWLGPGAELPQGLRFPFQVERILSPEG